MFSIAGFSIKEDGLLTCFWAFLQVVGLKKVISILPN